MTHTISEIAVMIGARREGGTEVKVRWVLTDSRSLSFPDETVFFALNRRAEAFVPELYARGVRAFIVQSGSKAAADLSDDATVLYVSDVLVALQRLAERHREQFTCPVIGIAGSNGKTIVKEWLYQMLMDDYNITRSPRSYNSQIGVPLSVWGMDEKTTLGIFEAGISKPGEMDRLQAVIQPTIGVFTNIGSAHQENFESKSQKMAEKLKLFKDCKVLVINKKLPYAAELLKGFKGRVITWDENNTGDLVIPFTDEASRQNAITCAAVCRCFGMQLSTINERLARLKPVAMRLEVKPGKRGVTIINDYANNDYESLAIALDFMMRLPEAEGKRHCVVLGDMQQTGLSPEELQKKNDALLSTKDVTTYFISPNKPDIANERWFATPEDFIRDVQLENCVVLLKGPSNGHFERISKALELQVHETKLNVDLAALVENFNAYRNKLVPSALGTPKMICMVKADAYGAGAVMVSKALQVAGVDYLAVAVADEGVALRRAGITKPIIVMNPEMHALRTLFEWNLQPECYSFRLLEALIAEARHEGVTDYPIHIKLDTGMHRLGFDPMTEMPLLIEKLRTQKAVLPISVFSHFVGSDEDCHDEFSALQYERYTHGADALQSAFEHHIMRHICNSAGIEHFQNRQMDMVRLGLGLYGINPRTDGMKLQPVSRLTTTILQIHDLPAGETIGYGRHTILTRQSRIAAIPIGYADGLNRRLGNRSGYCIVNGQRAEYVGNICMDVCMIDVTDIKCYEGDEVTIFGSEDLPVTVISDTLGTIPYEPLTLVSNRVQRIYYRE